MTSSKIICLLIFVSVKLYRSNWMEINQVREHTGEIRTAVDALQANRYHQWKPRVYHNLGITARSSLTCVMHVIEKYSFIGKIRCQLRRYIALSRSRCSIAHMHLSMEKVLVQGCQPWS